jgi:Ulp1 family protease
LDPDNEDPTSKWLDDACLEFVGHLMNDRERSKISENSKYPRKAVLPVFLSRLLFSSYYLDNDGMQDLYRYNDIWTIDVNSYDLLLAPININNNHSILMCINPRTHVMMLIDSLGKAYSLFRDCFLKWIELNYEKNNVPFHAEEWRFFTSQGPVQTNGFDCGMFVLTSCLFLLDNLPLSFTQSDMKTLRERVIYDIATSTIHSSYKYDDIVIAVGLDDIIDEPSPMPKQLRLEVSPDDISSTN